MPRELNAEAMRQCAAAMMDTFYDNSGAHGTENALAGTMLTMHMLLHSYEEAYTAEDFRDFDALAREFFEKRKPMVERLQRAVRELMRK